METGGASVLASRQSASSFPSRTARGATRTGQDARPTRPPDFAVDDLASRTQVHLTLR